MIKLDNANNYTASDVTGHGRRSDLTTTATTVINITASDVTGQKHARLNRVPSDTTIGEVLEGLLPRLRLHRLDREGTPVHFDARLQREERHLHRDEVVGDALKPDDHIVLHPRIMAGGWRRKTTVANPPTRLMNHAALRPARA